MKKRKHIVVFRWGSGLFDAKSLKIIGTNFLIKQIEEMNDITVRGATVGEVQLVIEKHMTGKNWRKKLMKNLLLSDK